MVAGLRFAAVLVELLGADLTAATAVPDQPDARGARGRLQGAVAGVGAGQRLEGQKTSVRLGAVSRRGAREGTRVSDPLSRVTPGRAAPAQSLFQGNVKKEGPETPPSPSPPPRPSFLV